jgi:hypothetical protein
MSRTQCPDTPDGLSAQTGGGHTLPLRGCPSVCPSAGEPTAEERGEKSHRTRAPSFGAIVRPGTSSGRYWREGVSERWREE